MKYKITVEILSPLHIGSGQELLANFDYKSDEQYTYILDQDVIYAHELEQNGIQARLDIPAGDLIATPSHPTLAHFVRYRLNGATPKGVERLREQIKDVYGGCYLPGSSLKGAIRRALAVWAIGKTEPHLFLEDLKDDPKGADDAWEAHLFGSDPNHDVLRMLQVGDSLPVSANYLMFCHAAVFQVGKEPGAPVDVEAISPGTKFQTEIKVDELLLQYTDGERFEEAMDELGWDVQSPWFTILPQILRQAAERLLEAEYQTCLDWGWQEPAAFYQDQIKALRALPENEAILQVGWGGGWLSKTIGLNLDDDQKFYLREKYDLGRPPKAGDDWSPSVDAPFPGSYRLSAITSSVGQDAPGSPLGWVKLIFDPIGTPLKADYWAALQKEALPLLQKPWTPLQADLPDGYQRPVRSQRKNVTLSEAGQQLGSLLMQSQEFTDPPQPGQSFLGKVFDVGSRYLLEIPGLDPDSQAYAVLEPGNYPATKRYSYDSQVLCEVVQVTDDHGVACLHCRAA